MKKIHIAIISLIILAFIISGFLYPQLPEKMASHWNTKGEVDDYISKFCGAFLMPIVSLVVYLLFLIIPKIDPLKENIKKFRSYFDGFILLMVAFLAYMHFLIIFWNLGYRFQMGQMMIPALAVLFYYSGILIEKAERNWFIGIRTPWTLSNPVVWDKTHELGARLFKGAALICLLGLFSTKYAMWFVLVPILAATFVSISYSFLEYRKLSREETS